MHLFMTVFLVSVLAVVLFFAQWALDWAWDKWGRIIGWLEADDGE